MRQETQFYNLRALSFLCWLGIIVPLYVIFVDRPFLAEEHFFGYAAGRVATAIMSLGLWISIKFFRIRSHWQMKAAMAILAFYAIHGQVYIPCYFLAYMQIAVAFGLFFPIPKREFYIFSAIGTIAMIITILYSEQIIGQSQYLITDPDQLMRYKFDTIMGVIIMTVISISGHHYFSIARMEKDLLSKKFIDVGRNASFVLHDFKGMLLAPSSYIDLLYDMKDEMSEDHQELLELLKDDYAAVKKYVIEANQISSNINMEEKEKFKLSEVVADVSTIFRNKISLGSQIVVKKDGELKFNKIIVKKVIYNLLINAFEAIPKNAIIEISLEGNTLKIQDNGPGFPKGVLKRLNKGKVIASSKMSGSSLGTLIIRDLIDSMNAQIRFANDEEKNGAIIMIDLPIEKKG